MTGAAVLSGLCALLVVPLALTAVRQRALATMALRNVGRRRTDAVLIVGGALLGTAIITSAFVVGDVIDGAVADEARTRYGPIDLVVSSGDRGTFDVAAVAARDAVRDDGRTTGTAEVAVDGLLDVMVTDAALEAPDRDTALPRVEVVTLDVAEARRFGGEGAATGLATTAVPAAGEVLVSAPTAQRLELRAGDPLRVHVAETTTEVRVADLLDAVGLAGYGDVLVAPGTLPSPSPAADGMAPVRHQLLVSLDGAGLDTREASGVAASALRAALDGRGDVRVDTPKAAVFDVAEQEGAGFTELFGTIGAFSVLAGVLLLVNLFTLLAEGRRTELGMLRAIGFTRRRLTRTFALEGVLYALPAALLGAALGTGIGWLVAVVAGSMLGVAEGARYPLVIEPVSLATGGALGLLVSVVTVWLASVRIARLNLVRAIRDLPEPSRTSLGRRASVASGVAVVAGVALTVTGVLQAVDPALLLGVPLATYAATPWLQRRFDERRVRLVVGVVVLGWALGVVPLFPAVMRFDDPVVFVLQGVVATAGAVSLVGGLDRVSAGLVTRASRGGSGVAARLGVAYPLALPTRTSLLRGIFALVVFTVTILSTVSLTFDRNGDTMAADVAAGADILVDTPPGGGAAAAALATRDDVAGVAEVTRGTATFRADHLATARQWTVTGFGADLVDRGVPAALASRDPAYASDAEVYRAVLADPTLAVVPEGFLAGVGATSTVVVGSTVTVQDPTTGGSHDLTIVGVGNLDWLGTGVLVGRPLAERVTAGAETGVRSYVEVRTSADPATVAASVNRAWLAAGADATPIATLVADAMGQQRGLFAMLQGYLGLGLLIGTAGLGVVMVRAVRERRQGIAMLRALGASSPLIRHAMLIEAALIVVQGTLIGVLLGLATSRQLLGVLDPDLTLAVPWVGLAVIVTVPLVASLAATAWPAARAAAIQPAVALRGAT